MESSFSFYRVSLFLYKVKTKGMTLITQFWSVILVIYFCLCNIVIQAQVPDLKIKEIISKVNIDSLVSHVRILSGEDSIEIGCQNQLITTRLSGTTTNRLAATDEWL